MPSSLDRLAQQVADDALRVAERATAHRPAGSPQGGQFAPGKGTTSEGNIVLAKKVVAREEHAAAATHDGGQRMHHQQNAAVARKVAGAKDQAQAWMHVRHNLDMSGSYIRGHRGGADAYQARFSSEWKGTGL